MAKKVTYPPKGPRTAKTRREMRKGADEALREYGVKVQKRKTKKKK